MKRQQQMNNIQSRVQWLGPMLVLLTLLASTSMTGNAAFTAPHHVAYPSRTLFFNCQQQQQQQQVSWQALSAAMHNDEEVGLHQKHSCEPILLVEAKKPAMSQAHMKRTASLATGALLALSLFFAPVPMIAATTPITAAVTDAVSFVSAQPAFAASKTVEQHAPVANVVPSTSEGPTKSTKAASGVVSATAPEAAAAQGKTNAKTASVAAATPEAQVKSAKTALVDASKRIKVAEAKVKTLDAALAKTEQSIKSSEQALQKAKEAVKQAEAKYRDLQNQKKADPKVLDKESMKVVNVKLNFQKAVDALATNKGKKIDLKTQAKTAGDDLRAAQKAELQATATLSTTEKNYANYQKQQADAKKAAEAKAKAKLALDQKKAEEKAKLEKIEASKAQAKAKAKLELEQKKARERAAQEALAAAKAKKRLEGRKEQIQMQTKDLQAELKSLQQKRNKDNAPTVDAQISVVKQKLDALKQALKDLTSSTTTTTTKK